MRDLSDISTLSALVQMWLNLQCRMIKGATKGVVILGSSEQGPFAPMAYWPADVDDAPDLTTVATMAIVKRSKVVRRKKDRKTPANKGSDTIAYPLMIMGHLLGVVAVEVKRDAGPGKNTALQMLQWGAVWLQVLIRQQADAINTRMLTVMELVTTCMEDEDFQASSMALVTDLATRLSCERVSIGFVHKGQIRVNALSHSATFEHKNNLIRDINEAMNEAVDQDCVISYTTQDDDNRAVTVAHATLSSRSNDHAICTVPFAENNKVIGALLLEKPKDKPFDAATVELCESIAELAGPLLELKRGVDRWIAWKLWDSWVNLLGRLFGPRHLSLKVSVWGLLSMLGFLLLSSGDYRVTATAILEGSVQQVVVAPIEGYIAASVKRAGDIVNEGDVLAYIDDKDLLLERATWQSQYEQRLRENRSARASHDSAQARIVAAQIDQAQAQIALIDEQLARTEITAPFDGIIVSGDLSQSLGAPVERGQVLFEIAPLEGYRVILKVDERDISAVQRMQDGQLALSSLPGEVFLLSIERITPVSTAEEGRNYFRVEAVIEGPTERLRPGMEGIGKIEIGQRKLFWIWTHNLVDWLRLKIWGWWP